MNCDRCGGFTILDCFDGPTLCEGFRCINCGAISDLRMIMPVRSPERAIEKRRPKTPPAPVVPPAALAASEPR